MTSVSQRGLPGTRPEGTRDEAEAAAHVREMFGRIAPRYDLLNHLLSLDIDKVWRRRVARAFRAVLGDANARVLDLCCGTGDLAFAFRREAPNGAQIIGSDFVPEMLVRARSKAVAFGVAVEFIEADALQLPFADAELRSGFIRVRIPQSRQLRARLKRNPSSTEAGRRRRDSGICGTAGKSLRRSLPILFQECSSASWWHDFGQCIGVFVSPQLGEQVPAS